MSNNELLNELEPAFSVDDMQALLQAYNAYIMDEFEKEPETLATLFTSVLGLAYTELGNENQFPVQVDLSASALEIRYYLFDELKDIEKYASIEDLTQAIKGRDFMDYISPFYDWIPEDEQ